MRILIAIYVFQGNAELLSISSDDSIWNSGDEDDGEKSDTGWSCSDCLRSTGLAQSYLVNEQSTLAVRTMQTTFCADGYVKEPVFYCIHFQYSFYSLSFDGKSLTHVFLQETRMTLKKRCQGLSMNTVTPLWEVRATSLGLTVMEGKGAWR